MPRHEPAAPRLLLLASLLAVPSCAPAYPPVAATGGDTAFKARIATDFPPGSSGERLRTELAREGFVIAGDPRTGFFSALDRPPNVPCFSETRIDWRENRRGRITVIQAARHACT